MLKITGPCFPPVRLLVILINPISELRMHRLLNLQRENSIIFNSPRLNLYRSSVTLVSTLYLFMNQAATCGMFQAGVWNNFRTFQFFDVMGSTF